MNFPPDTIWVAGKNPKTEEPTMVKPKKMPFFKFGKELMEQVNS
jgi:nucleoid DNA-binding protein